MNLIKKEELSLKYQRIRQQTLSLCSPLAIEDYVIQSIEEVSPPKWHLAHTTWFFETFILENYLSNYQSYNSSFRYLFNSYYQGIGCPYPRAKRGLLSRPKVETIYEYRQYVDEHILALLQQISSSRLETVISNIILGLEHEQQHQELLLMDIKHNFSIDPYLPCYKTESHQALKFPLSKMDFVENEGSLVDIGNFTKGFCFDNELPAHKKFLAPFALATRLVSNREYLEFIEDKAYQNPRLWLSDGWDSLIKNNWQAPLYWCLQDNKWSIFTLNGLSPLNLEEPVSHLSFYEAEAYARWRGMRLPTEEEWEHFVISNSLTIEKSNMLENGFFHPQPAQKEEKLSQQFFGDLWEWTASAYLPYPGYETFPNELAEYNGKFMANQMVLRGGCCVTPKSHIRASYRNFYPPDKRWQFSGIRLAKNLKE